MKNLSQKEAITILESMRVDIPVPKAAVTQKKRNVALDMAINALNCSEIPNSSDSIIRQAAIDVLDKRFDNVPMEQTAEILKLRKDLRELPSAEPEVIRCKECKHWYKDADSGMSCEYTAMSQPEDGFCNWAERGGEKE